MTAINIDEGTVLTEFGSLDEADIHTFNINDLTSNQFKIVYGNIWESLEYQSLYHYYFLHRKPLLYIRKNILCIRANLARILSLKKHDLHHVVCCLVDKADPRTSGLVSINERQLLEIINPRVKYLYDNERRRNTHKDFIITESYYRCLLDALLENGDLEEGNMCYVIKPKLFLTHHAMEVEAKRHRQVLIVAVVAAIAASVSALSGFGSIFNS
ncbi:hypothetical protein NI382_13960 [Vibrio parahaemolyticus]|nr:hypothetical protein NI382_13960 [Vibrio parahaemolyticus]